MKKVCRQSLFIIQHSSLLLTLAMVWAGGRAFGSELDGFGPFPVRNFQPMQVLILGMMGDRAATVPKGILDVRIEMAETSSVFREETDHVSATIKMETLRSALFFRYGLTDRLELRLEIPALYRYRGFLEGIIKATERATTGLAPARNALQGTGFAFTLTRDGQTLFAGGDQELGLGDITLSGKYLMVRQSARLPAIAFRLALKMPSGDDRRFFGSGHADVGVGLAVEKSLTNRLILYTNLNGIFPTGRIAGLPLSPAMSSILALEYLWTPRLSLVVQFDYFSSPYNNTGTRILDRGVTEVSAGFNYRLRSNLLWQVYGVENVDFITGSAADFTLSTLVTYRFRTS